MVDSVSDESLRVVAVGLVAMAAIAVGAAAVSAGIDGVPSSPSDDPEVDTGTQIGDGGLQPDGPEEVLVRASGDQTVSDVSRTASATDDGDPLTTRDLAIAAGRAADRLEGHDAAVENEVYRAWWEMTSLLAVPDPDTATPGEFADAAVAAGLDEADVAELTRLFEDVRYGERDAGAEPIGDSGAADSDGTATREERAVSVFRAIEAAHPGADSRDDPSASGQRSNSER